MANPTTNYGWPMPTSTDLVTDLPADFALFGQPVDTSLKALNPETTLGDIAYRSSTSNTNTRLGIGSSAQVLTVASGVPSWATPTASASGLTLINTTSFSASTAVNVDNVFSATYNVYKIVLSGISSSGPGNLGLRMRVSSTDLTTAGVYRYGGIEFGDNSSSVGFINSGTTATFQRFIYLDGNANDRGTAIMDMFEPFSTSLTLTHNWENRIRPGSTPMGFGGMQHGGINNSTSYTGFSLIADANNFTGTVRTYGLQNS